MKKLFSFALLILLVALTACEGKSDRSLTRVRLSLGYVPNIQFAPIYSAIANGHFAAEGLEVEIGHMDENQAVALVGSGDLEFAIVSGEQVLLARAQGLPVVYVMAWYQRYPVSVVATSSEDIDSPDDLRGKIIGLPGLYGATYIGLRALLYAGGLTEADVTLESIGYTQVEAFVSGRNSVICGYTTNEPVQLRARGYQITELRVSDYVHLASNGLLVSETTLRENPELVRRMVRGLLKGLQDVMADPESAYRIARDFVEGLAEDDPIQMQVLLTSIELWRAERLGYSDPQAWQNMQETLLQMGLLSAPLDLSKAFTNEFVP
ncbi:MAG: ABC transporter substrate-binding protein [Anaerolineales bacterium]|nr:ABC transporter substrate-binding protein [Anaerolineales bacterium]MCX7608475.1 ABC transporter substrate-binding protein [Anaerolineales bacterium]MDW8227583.1 ABC transporter substrate-binding protein [Anaerolineales bacterium]